MGALIAAAAVPTCLFLMALSLILYKFRVEVLIALDRIRAMLNVFLDLVEYLRECLKVDQVEHVDDVEAATPGVPMPTNMCDSELVAMQQWV